MAQRPKHVDPLPMREWLDRARLGDPAPAILHLRSGTKTLFVEIQQLAPLLTIDLAQFPNHPARAFESLLVAFFFKPHR